MRSMKYVAAVAVIGLAALGTAAFGSSAAAAPVATPHSVRACPAVAKGAACLAWVRTDIKPKLNLVSPAATPSGFGPATLRAAYGLTSSGSATQTVGIVDAFDDPAAESNLGTYRSQFGLPACTTANGCFKKVNQTGGTRYPAANTGWAEEISLDVDMVSAICPNCHILLVEASSTSFANLGAAVNYAAAHANAVSNSYGGSDTADTSAPYYNHPGVAITASSGDGGFGVEFPASSRYVTAVGGTHLVMSGNTRSSETAWNGAGSGCSTKNPALSGQASFGTGCAKRAVADVSAVADPNTGVAVYDTQGGVGGWLVFGGTSVASPIIASVYALAGNESSINNNFPYTHDAGNFHDITSGSNGSCSPSQLCTARVGWDGPTGLGTPNGTGGF